MPEKGQQTAVSAEFVKNILAHGHRFFKPEYAKDETLWSNGHLNTFEVQILSLLPFFIRNKLENLWFCSKVGTNISF